MMIRIEMMKKFFISDMIMVNINILSVLCLLVSVKKWNRIIIILNMVVIVYGILFFLREKFRVIYNILRFVKNRLNWFF